MNKIPLVDLNLQYGEIKEEIDRALRRVLERTDFILGEDVRRFEEEFALFVEADHAVGVASGTDALKLILKALQIGPGDEIIMPCNTFAATAYATSEVGAKPVLVDIDEKTYNLRIDHVADRITAGTKAIMPVHLYGRPVDMDDLLAVTKLQGVPVVEDACQAHGAVNRGKKVGSIGAAAAFSFYPGKNLGAYGDGGMVTTNKESIARSVRMLRNYGQSKKYHHDMLGYNSRLDTLQAAVLRVKLGHLEEWNRRRGEIADRYRDALGESPVLLPDEPEDSIHVYHLFVIRTEKRDELLVYLNENGIGAGIHYPVPIHMHPAYRFLNYRKGDFPVAERVCGEILSLPLYPEMTDDQARAVAEHVKKFFR